jgi:hypothetical protein
MEKRLHGAVRTRELLKKKHADNSRSRKKKQLSSYRVIEFSSYLQKNGEKKEEENNPNCS